MACRDIARLRHHRLGYGDVVMTFEITRPDRRFRPPWLRNDRTGHTHKQTAQPSELQRAALIAARDGGRLTLTRGCGLGVRGLWIAETNCGAHRTDVVMACKRRGWLAGADGYENAIEPNWAPVVITSAGRAALTKGEQTP